MYRLRRARSRRHRGIAVSVIVWKNPSAVGGRIREGHADGAAHCRNFAKLDSTERGRAVCHLVDVGVSQLAQKNDAAAARSHVNHRVMRYVRDLCVGRRRGYDKRQFDEKVWMSS